CSCVIDEHWHGRPTFCSFILIRTATKTGSRLASCRPWFTKPQKMGRWNCLGSSTCSEPLSVLLLREACSAAFNGNGPKGGEPPLMREHESKCRPVCEGRLGRSHDGGEVVLWRSGQDHSCGN